MKSIYRLRFTSILEATQKIHNMLLALDSYLSLFVCVCEE